MNPKMMAVLTMALAIVPFWFAMIVQDMTLRGAGLVAIVVATAGAIWFLDGYRAAMLVCAGLVVIAGLVVVARTIRDKLRRRRLAPGSDPTDVDLQHWCERVIKAAGWKPIFRAKPTRLTVKKDKHQELELYISADWRKLGDVEIRLFGSHTTKTKNPVFLVTCTPVSDIVDASLRERRATPIEHHLLADLLKHATSRRDLENAEVNRAFRARNTPVDQPALATA